MTRFRKRKRKNFRTTKEKELVHKVKHKKKLTQRSRKIQTRKGNKQKEEKIEHYKKRKITKIGSEKLSGGKMTSMDYQKSNSPNETKYLYGTYS